MKNKFLKLTTLPLVSTIVLTPIIATSITQCSNIKQEDPCDYIGNADGSNWKGHVSGTLNLEFNEEEKTVMIIDGNESYEADCLYIPQFVEKDGVEYTLNELNNSAFENCNNLNGIVLPQTIKVINEYALANCPGLISDVEENNKIFCDSNHTYYLKNNNTYYCLGWGFNVYDDDQRPKPEGNLNIKENTKIICHCAFFECDDLTGELVIPDTVKYINRSAFSYCRFTGDLVIPNSVIEIGITAFRDSFNKSQSETTYDLIIGKNVEIVSNQAFLNCWFETITFKSVLKDNGSNMFGNNTAVKQIIFDGIKTSPYFHAYSTPFQPTAFSIYVPDGKVKRVNTSVSAQVCLQVCIDEGGLPNTWTAA